MRDFNIEFCHIYSDALVKRDFSALQQGVEITRAIVKQLKNDGRTYSLNVLVDNYFGKYPNPDITPLREFLAAEGLQSDGFYLEADMVSVCPEFIERMRSANIIKTPYDLSFVSNDLDIHLYRRMPTETLKSSFLRGAKAAEHSPSENNDFFSERSGRCQHSSKTIIMQAIQGSIRYSCPLLAACWTLARFGVSPFIDALSTMRSSRQREAFIGGQLITILPAMYLDVENTVLDLLANLRTKSLRRLRNRINYQFFSGDSER